MLDVRGFSLEWYSAKTGGVKSTSGYQTHFGINNADLITVYAYDIAKLESWEQHVWSAHNIIPDGKVAEELLSAQVKCKPANTKSAENLLFEVIELLERHFNEVYGINLFTSETNFSDYSKKILRFNSQNLDSLLRLAKDLVRFFSDRLNIKELRKLSTHTDKEKLGSNKLLQNILSQKVNDERAKELMGVIFGVYDMRLGDAHPAGSQIEDALNVAKIDTSLSFLKQGEQLISNYGQAINEIDRVLFDENYESNILD